MKKPSKKATAKKQSWQPGGAHRIAYEQRMQAKKTMDHRTSQPASAVIGHPEAEIASRYYRAACVLLLTDVLYRTQAERLIAAADTLLGDDQ